MRKERGRGQIGTMGSGNHFVEVQEVDAILDADAARAFGLREQQVTVLIHSGSRGLGHQVCTDYVKAMDGAMRRYGIALDDRQLACAPASSPEGPSPTSRRWRRPPTSHGPTGRRLRTPCAAPSRASWAQRRSGDASGLRRRAQRRQDRGVRRRVLCVHRKGATSAFPAGAADPRRLPRRRSAGLHPREHGDGELRARRASPGRWRSRSVPTCHGAGRAV